MKTFQVIQNKKTILIKLELGTLKDQQISQYNQNNKCFKYFFPLSLIFEKHF